MLRKVHLYGRAKELFGKANGKPLMYDADTIPEIIRALCCTLKGFRQFLEAHDFHIVRGLTRRGGKTVKVEYLPMALNDHDVYIMPAARVAGSGMKGVGKLIAGVLLAGFAFWAAPALGITQIAGIGVNNIGLLGVGLAIQGVSSLISGNDQTKDKSSNIFGSAPNMAQQGQPIAVVYGRDRIDDPPIVSAGIRTRNVAAT